MGPTTPSLSVTHWQDVQTLLKGSSYREPFPLMTTHLQQFFGPTNLLTLNGKEWKQQRKLLVRALHGQAFIENNKHAIQQASNVLVRSLEQEIRNTSKNSQTNDGICRNGDTSSQHSDDYPYYYECQDVSKLLRLVTLDSFGQAALHIDMGCCHNLRLSSKIAAAFDYTACEIQRRMQSLLNPTTHLYWIPTKSNREYHYHQQYLKTYVKGIIEKRRVEIENLNTRLGEGGTANEQNITDAVPQDLLTSLILEDARNNHDTDNTTSTTTTSKSSIYLDGNSPQQQEFLVDTLKGLLFAAYETTSTVLTYCLYMVAKHPSVEQTCYNEIMMNNTNNNNFSNDSSSKWRNVDCLHYVQAVIQETMRLFPPVISTTRTADRDMTLDSTVIVPKGTYLYFPIWTIQRSAMNFPDPLEFRPERWVERSSTAAATTENIDASWQKREWKHNKDSSSGNGISISENTNPDVIPEGNPWAFCAFSAGARNCAGEKFAMQEMVIILSELIEHFTFEIVPKDYELKLHKPGIVTAPKTPVSMRIKSRQSM